MGLLEERFPGRRNEILTSSGRLRVILKTDRGGTPEMEIAGNRAGLRALAAI
jgi:hypothetical protein